MCNNFYIYPGTYVYFRYESNFPLGPESSSETGISLSVKVFIRWVQIQTDISLIVEMIKFSWFNFVILYKFDPYKYEGQVYILTQIKKEASQDMMDMGTKRSLLVRTKGLRTRRNSSPGHLGVGTGTKNGRELAK